MLVLFCMFVRGKSVVIKMLVIKKKECSFRVANSIYDRKLSLLTTPGQVVIAYVSSDHVIINLRVYKLSRVFGE